MQGKESLTDKMLIRCHKEVRKKAMSPWDGGAGRGPSRESSKYTGSEAGACLEGSTKRKEARMRGMATSGVHRSGMAFWSV